MNININIIESKPKKQWGVVSVKGEIQIDDFRESLYIPLGWWSLDDYKKQWQEGLRRLANHDKSCLVVGIDNPKVRKFIEWWVLYKIDNKIYIRNKIAVDDIYSEQIGDRPFTIQNCYDFIPERGPKFNSEGREISEWVIEYD